MPQLHMVHGHCGKVNKTKKHTIQCPMPFLHYNIKLDRKSTACWRCLENLGDYTENSLLDVWHGEKWQDFRRQHLCGEKPRGCKSCWQMEEKGLSSTRTDVTQEFADEIAEMETWDEEKLLKPDFPSDIEIRFGNLCNLQCRHCSPTYSSQWMKQLKVNEKYIIQAKEFIEDLSDKESISVLPNHTTNNLKELAPGLKYIKITGGEPLMHPLHYEMLEAFSGYEHNITLEYNTNLHYLGLGNQSVFDYWHKFKKVICRVSVDADESAYEYMRANGNLSILKDNWKKVETEFKERIINGTFDLHATCTVNMLNITRMPEVFKFFSKLGSKLHTSLVQYPTVMDVCNLPEWQKKKIIEQCQNLIEEAAEYQFDHWLYQDKTTKRYEKITEYNVQTLKKIIGWVNRKPNTEFENQFSAVFE